MAQRIEDIFKAQGDFLSQMQQQMQQLSQQTNAGVVLPDKREQLKQYEQRLQAVTAERAAAVNRYDERINRLTKEITQLKEELSTSREEDTPTRSNPGSTRPDPSVPTRPNPGNLGQVTESRRRTDIRDNLGNNPPNRPSDR